MMELWGTGAKVWLWLVLILNAISCITLFPLLLIVPVAAAISIVLELALIAGVVMLLFKRKKIGFYMLCGCALLSMITNIIAGTGIIRAIASTVLLPTITFLVIRDQWNDLA